jgi:ATP-dependent exoDNAse (exonuclease V) alpha subunit
VWAIAVPWWILLALVVTGLLAGRKEATAKAAAEAAAEGQRRVEAARQELADREAAALEALEEAKRTGWLRLDGETAYAYAGVTPDGDRCHHRHRSPQAAAECAARLMKTA